MKIDCLLHVHSSFSYDSRTDLADVAAVARRHGIGCVLMSEHNNRLDAEQVAIFVARCEALSDDRLLIIPGLELAFDANRVHLLAYGIRRFIDSTAATCTIRSLIDAIHDAGGLAVLAHPSHRQAVQRLTADDLARLDGIEVWNVKNGNRYVPSAADISLLNRVRASGGPAFAYGGLDWHHLNRFSRFVVTVEVGTFSESAVLTALRESRYVTRGAFVAVPASGEVNAARFAAYRLVSGTVNGTRRVAYRWQSAIERRGLKVPAMLSAIARRVF